MTKVRNLSIVPALAVGDQVLIQSETSPLLVPATSLLEWVEKGTTDLADPAAWRGVDPLQLSSLPRATELTTDTLFVIFDPLASKTVLKPICQIEMTDYFVLYTQRDREPRKIIATALGITGLCVVPCGCCPNEVVFQTTDDNAVIAATTSPLGYFVPASLTSVFGVGFTDGADIPNNYLYTANRTTGALTLSRDATADYVGLFGSGAKVSSTPCTAGNYGVVLGIRSVVATSHTFFICTHSLGDLALVSSGSVTVSDYGAFTETAGFDSLTGVGRIIAISRSDGSYRLFACAGWETGAGIGQSGFGVLTAVVGVTGVVASAQLIQWPQSWTDWSFPSTDFYSSRFAVGGGKVFQIIDGHFGAGAQDQRRMISAWDIETGAYLASATINLTTPGTVWYPAQITYDLRLGRLCVFAAVQNGDVSTLRSYCYIINPSSLAVEETRDITAVAPFMYFDKGQAIIGAQPTIDCAFYVLTMDAAQDNEIVIGYDPVADTFSRELIPFSYFGSDTAQDITWFDEDMSMLWVASDTDNTKMGVLPVA